MTNRVSALTVVLAEDAREDDVQGLVDAIARFAGVIRVSTHVVDIADHVAESRAKRLIMNAVLEALK